MGPDRLVGDPLGPPRWPLARLLRLVGIVRRRELLLARFVQASTCFFKMGIPGLFFFIFVLSIQLRVNGKYKFLPMTGFEPRPSGIGSYRSTN